MNLEELIDKNIVPRLKRYLIDINKQKNDYQLDGVRVFKRENPEDRFDVFLSGKLANVASYVLVNVKNNEPQEYQYWKEVITSIIEFTLTLPIETWGILNYFWALQRLTKNEIFNDVINEETKKLIKEKLEWRTFVNEETLELIGKPTNYYGVAFAIAKYRELYGFDNINYSEKLLTKLINHIKEYSSEFMFMDETEGEGRFDRYSCLIPGELAQHCFNFNMSLDETIRKMLRNSSDIFLALANERGDGFSYGRSIGPYGDTASLEVLSIAALFGVLTEREIQISYLYSLAACKKLIEFWTDKEMDSINMWEKGRRTDSYRFKGRILGENFSIAMQHCTTLEHYKILGYHQKEFAEKMICKNLNLPPNSKFFYFSRNDYDRAMLIYRYDNKVFQLPMINGSNNYYDKAPYAPVMQMLRLIEMPPENSMPFLYPHFIMKDGTRISALAYLKDIKFINNLLTYNTDSMAIVKLNSEDVMEKDNSSTLNISSVIERFEGIFALVSYEFLDNTIEFKIKLQGNNESLNEIAALEMYYGSFAKISSNNNTTIAYANKTEITFSNLQIAEKIFFDDDWRFKTNHGQYDNVLKIKAKDLREFEYGYIFKF